MVVRRRWRGGDNSSGSGGGCSGGEERRESLERERGRERSVFGKMKLCPVFPSLPGPKWILHDWSDEYCLKLLKNCYDVIPDDGKIIVLEAVLPIIPETNATCRAISQLDVLMMTQNPGGKERTEQQFMELAIAAGFSGIRYECYVRTFWVMEFFK